jgi:DDE superfamily endonuclease
MSQYRADQLVFLDESGINTHMGERTHGWGPKGKRIQHKVSGQKAPNVSLLPALTVDGYIACTIFKGSVNKERFMHFLKTDLLPRCGKFPEPRSVLVMDNAKIHKNLDEVCQCRLILTLMLGSNGAFEKTQNQG